MSFGEQKVSNQRGMNLLVLLLSVSMCPCQPQKTAVLSSNNPTLNPDEGCPKVVGSTFQDKSTMFVCADPGTIYPGGKCVYLGRSEPKPVAVARD